MGQRRELCLQPTGQNPANQGARAFARARLSTASYGPSEAHRESGVERSHAPVCLYIGEATPTIADHATHGVRTILDDHTLHFTIATVRIAP